MTIYMIIDTQNDPEETDENGMSEAFVKSTKTGRILRTKDIQKARRWRDNRNKGIDLGEPDFAILAFDLDSETQRIVA